MAGGKERGHRRHHDSRAGRQEPGQHPHRISPALLPEEVRVRPEREHDEADPEGKGRVPGVPFRQGQQGRGARILRQAVQGDPQEPEERGVGDTGQFGVVGCRAYGREDMDDLSCFMLL